MTIIVNGKKVEIRGNMIGYRGILKIAGFSPDALVTVTHTYLGGGTLHKGTSTYCRTGTIFNAFDTSAA